MKTMLLAIAFIAQTAVAANQKIAVCDGAENAVINLLKVNGKTYQLKAESGAYHYVSKYIQDVLTVDLNLDLQNSSDEIKKLGVTNNKDLELYLLEDEKNLKINIFSVEEDYKLVESINCDKI
jgi:hypothetical protein